MSRSDFVALAPEVKRARVVPDAGVKWRYVRSLSLSHRPHFVPSPGFIQGSLGENAGGSDAALRDGRDARCLFGLGQAPV